MTSGRRLAQEKTEQKQQGIPQTSIAKNLTSVRAFGPEEVVSPARCCTSTLLTHPTAEESGQESGEDILTLQTVLNAVRDDMQERAAKVLQDKTSDLEKAVLELKGVSQGPGGHWKHGLNDEATVEQCIEAAEAAGLLQPAFSDKQTKRFVSTKEAKKSVEEVQKAFENYDVEAEVKLQELLDEAAELMTVSKAVSLEIHLVKAFTCKQDEEVKKLVNTVLKRLTGVPQGHVHPSLLARAIEVARG